MNRQELLACYQKIKPHIHETPVLTSRILNHISGLELYFKCENFQRTGSFKIRGALHAILQLDNASRPKGVVTHSSGNFAQALSLAAKELGIAAYIVMPSNAPLVKKEAVKNYGGIIIECPPTLQDREQATLQIQKDKKALFIHPSNDLSVILGQSTIATELLKKHPNLDYIISPIGGGGLIAGAALASHFLGYDCKIVGAEPIEADDAYRSLQSDKIETNKTVNTIADGLRTSLGNINFPIIKKYVSQIIPVEEIEIIDAMRLIWQHMKIIIEPSSAVALAAVLKNKQQFKTKKIGVILSGGNVDLNHLPF